MRVPEGKSPRESAAGGAPDPTDHWGTRALARTPPSEAEPSGLGFGVAAGKFRFPHLRRRMCALSRAGSVRHGPCVCSCHIRTVARAHPVRLRLPRPLLPLSSYPTLIFSIASRKKGRKPAAPRGPDPASENRREPRCDVLGEKSGRACGGPTDEA